MIKLKNAFTLIELLVTITIISTLLTIAVPIYDKQILKGYFDEAKVTIQAIALAQERYKIETGVYYPDADESIVNENIINTNLKIDLSKTNNFVYHVTGAADGKSYVLKAVLRDVAWATDCDASDKTDLCKQDNTINRDSWTEKYNTATTKHFISFSYPTPSANAVNGIDYTDIYTGD